MHRNEPKTSLKWLVWNSNCRGIKVTIQGLNYDQRSVFFLNGPFPASFSLFLSFLQTVNSKKMFNKSCQWLDSNLGPLILEATALPTAPQPLRCLFALDIWLLPSYKCISFVGWTLQNAFLFPFILMNFLTRDSIGEFV